jgi:transaldolase/glucose-6-phosphate isomerase
MSSNALRNVQKHGQSIWLDHIDRQLILSGGLRAMIEDDGLRGVTSNPSIFEEAIGGGGVYAGLIAALALADRSAEQIYEALTVGDVQLAADEFRELHAASAGNHGFVSLEVNPHLAYDSEATVAEARRLWRSTDRPNVFIKVPATEAGLGAIRRLIAEGINVNVTLLFGLPRYRRAAEAYLAGLEDRLASGQPVHDVHSVASFFLSRIDALVDPQLEVLKAVGGERSAIADKLQGQAAVASARLAYEIYLEILSGDRFEKLANRGARPQRVLWASTSTKNPEYSDVKYVEALIGPATINTLPRETYDAYRDHGEPAPRLETGLEAAREVMRSLFEVGIDIDRVTAQLEAEGVEKFNRPYDVLLATLAVKRNEARGARANRQRIAVGDRSAAIADRLAQLRERGFCERLFRRDASAWGGDAEVQRQIGDSLGWLAAPRRMTGRVTELLSFAREVRAAGFRHVVHMGMGGSSLAPLVFQRCFAPREGGLPLTVLDSTAPETLAAIANALPLARTLFIVASKSGTTTEPLDLAAFFHARIAEEKGRNAGENFVAITDPGTTLAELASERGFRRVFASSPDVGDRYSALSYFGLVPAALLGVDIAALLARAQLMMRECSVCMPLCENPGVCLGVVLGELARAGRDKITFCADPELETFGMWLEQLLAESTGKQATGLVPIVGEPLVDPDAYAHDRVFVQLRLAEGGPSERDTEDGARGALQRIAAAGHPVIAIPLRDQLDLGQEFVRWEVATATAGAVLGINPFDQPNVQAAKDFANRVLFRLGREHRVPREEADATGESGLSLHGAPAADSLLAALTDFVGRTRDGDYLSLLAYLPENRRTDEALSNLREEALRRRGIATTVAYGPRYLHSTGQLHKGGPPSGSFLLLTGDAGPRVPVPGKGYTFGELQLAQAMGDLQALRERDRRVLHVHLGQDVTAAFAELERAFSQALRQS